MDGGFDNKEPEYEESYSIVILPDFVSLPFPSVELPEKVLSNVLLCGLSFVTATCTCLNSFFFCVFIIAGEDCG